MTAQTTHLNYNCSLKFLHNFLLHPQVQCDNELLPADVGLPQ